MPRAKLLQSFFLIVFFCSLVMSSVWQLQHLSSVSAASSWVQTDWVGGSGQTAWSNTTQFSSATSINHTTAGQLTLSSSTAGNWYNASWVYRKQITLASSQVSGGADLTDFPVLISLGSDASLASHALSSGNDILFTAADGVTKLSHEIEKYTTGSGQLIAWVKIPTLSAASDTPIYLYYGNAGSGDQQNRNDVWSNGFVAVWHLKESVAAAAPQFLDSASTNHGTAQFMTVASNITGQIDGALSLPDSSDHVSIGDPVALRLTSNMTVTAWANATDFNNGSRIISKLGFANQRGFSLNFDSGLNKASFSVANTSNSIQQVDTATTPPFGSWIYLAGTYEPSTALRIYLDGALSNSNTTSIGATQHSNNSQEIRIGNRPVYSGDYNGKVDEIRIASVTRSAGWIGTEYNNQSSPGTFYSLGSAETSTSFASPGTLVSSIYDTTLGGNWGTLTYTATTPTNTAVVVKARSSNSSSMSGATAFASCTAITSGSDISGNTCISDGQRYIQYEVTLTTSDSGVTPTFSDVTITYDGVNQNPTVSLTSPGSYVTTTTPAITGTASDADGTVSAVEYQMDGTGGSWIACTASDGTFDEASEAFACSVSPALSQGSHTIYVRATDDASAVSTTANEAFIVDSVAPTLSNLVLTPADTSVTATWDTDEASSTLASFGVDTLTENTAETDTSPRVTSHSLTIPSLVPCTYYVIQVSSLDAAENQGDDNSYFNTTGCPASASVISQNSDTISNTTGGSMSLVTADNTLTIAPAAAYSTGDLTFQLKELSSATLPATTGVPSGYTWVANHHYYLSAYSDNETEVTTFLSPVTVNMTYTAGQVNTLDEDSLKIFRWDGSEWHELSSCSVSLSTKTVSCQTTAFSVFGLFGLPATSSPVTDTGSGTGTTSGTTPATPPQCTATVPGSKAPWLYSAVPVSSTQIMLYFASADGPLDHYALEFGTQSGQYIHGLDSWGNADSRTYLVNHLSPGTTYYFRVRGGNGCAPGPWSNELKARSKSLTRGSQLSFESSEVVVDTSSSSQEEPIILPELEILSSPAPSPSPVPSALMLPTPTPAWLAPKGTQLTIKVTDTENNPIENAEVEIHSVVQRGTTDAQGRVIFASVEPGNHKVSVNYQGFTGEQSLDVKEGSGDITLNLSVNLRPGYWAQISMIATPILAIILFLLVIVILRKSRKRDNSPPSLMVRS